LYSHLFFSQNLQAPIERYATPAAYPHVAT
jgi:hypothetical protein